MKVDGTLILYTSDPASGAMCSLLAHLQARGQEVFLRPLSQLTTKKKAWVTPVLHGSLRTLTPN